MKKVSHPLEFFTEELEPDWGWTSEIYSKKVKLVVEGIMGLYSMWNNAGSSAGRL